MHRWGSPHRTISSTITNIIPHLLRVGFLFHPEYILSMCLVWFRGGSIHRFLQRCFRVKYFVRVVSILEFRIQHGSTRVHTHAHTHTLFYRCEDFHIHTSKLRASLQSAVMMTRPQLLAHVPLRCVLRWRASRRSCTYRCMGLCR